MSETQESLRSTASAVVRRMTVKTGILVLLAALSVTAFPLLGRSEEGWWFVPASLLFGGLLGVLNFRWLTQTVERVYLRRGITPAAANIAGIVLTALKLSAIFIVLFIVIKWGLAHLLGLVAGLSLSFIAILWEGFLIMTGTHQQ